MQCGDGQQASFVGATRLTFQDVTTCRIKVGPSIGVVQITGSAAFSCVESAGRINCAGA